MFLCVICGWKFGFMKSVYRGRPVSTGLSHGHKKSGRLAWSRPPDCRFPGVRETELGLVIYFTKVTEPVPVKLPE